MGIGSLTNVIASASVDYATGKTLSDVGTAMLSKTLDLQEAQGGQLTKMMEMSVNPAVGGNFDISV